MLAYVEIALSAIVILVFAVERFNAPPADPRSAIVPYRTCRSTTTAASYYTAVSLYGAAALGVFAFLLLSPQALDRLLAAAPEVGASVPGWARQSPSLLVALILTVLVPKVPALSAVDEWVRTRLQRMAAIPHEVRRLGTTLRRARFRIGEERRQELLEALRDRGFEPGDIRFEDGRAPHSLWTKLAALMRELDGWEADPQFTGYVLTYPHEFSALRQRYEALLPRARKCFALLRELASDDTDARKSGAVYAYRDDFVEEVEGLLKDVYEAISHAVLLCELTQRARVRALIGLGFDLDPEPPRRLTLNELLALFTGIAVVFAFGFVVRRPGAHIEFDLFVKAVMIAAIYCVAVWCAIYPKSRWAFARRHPGTGRPWGSYLLSGAVAAAAGGLVSFAVRLAAAHGDLARAWEAYRAVSPWGVMTFATAYGVAFLADDEADQGAGPLGVAWLRWTEGLGLAALLAGSAWVVRGLLLSTSAPVSVRPLGEILVFTVVIGFAIGALVPSWYRTAPREAPHDVRALAGVRTSARSA